MKESEQQKAKQIAKKIGIIIQKALPEDYGFALFTFPFYIGGEVSYISSAERNDMIKVLKDIIDDLEKDMAKKNDSNS